MASGLGKLAGIGAAGEQLLIYNVLGAIVQAVLGPELLLLTREVNKILPATPLSPADLADMVVRNIVDATDATNYAAESGISAADFKRMIQSAGEAPSPQELVTALRRGIIPHDGTGPDAISFEQGIAEGRLFNKWRPVIETLATVPLSAADAVDAVVENQIDLATGQHIAYLNGMSADDFQIALNTRGNPPSPGELATLLKRGLIQLEGTGPDAVTFQQGIFEGATKDKWWKYFAALADYIPPPRTVVSLIRDGAITDQQGLQLFQQGGLTPEFAQIYLQNAHFQRTTAHKSVISSELRSIARKGYIDGQLSEAQFRQLLTQAAVPADLVDNEVAAANLTKQFGRHTFSVSQIKKQRQEGLIDDATALQRLILAGWSEEDAQAQLAEWASESAAGRSGLTENRILAYLISGILTPVEAYDRLVALGISSANATFLVQHPQSSPAVKMHGSTAADIIAAYKDGILDLPTAQQKLIDAGDTSDAATLKLQVANVQLNRGSKPKLAHKNLTEAQILEAFRLGFASDTWTLRELQTLGYSDVDASLLVAIEQTKLAPTAPASWITLT